MASILLHQDSTGKVHVVSFAATLDVLFNFFLTSCLHCPGLPSFLSLCRSCIFFSFSYSFVTVSSSVLCGGRLRVRELFRQTDCRPRSRNISAALVHGAERTKLYIIRVCQYPDDTAIHRKTPRLDVVEKTIKGFWFNDRLLRKPRDNIVVVLYQRTTIRGWPRGKITWRRKKNIYIRNLLCSGKNIRQGLIRRNAVMWRSCTAHHNHWDLCEMCRRGWD